MPESEVGELLHQRGWRTAFTVADRVSAWAALVSVVWHGYGDDTYEYTNELSCRNWLHEAWILLDDHNQFHRLPGPDLWWWRRHPRILIGDLGRALRSVGAIGTDPDTA